MVCEVVIEKGKPMVMLDDPKLKIKVYLDEYRMGGAVEGSKVYIKLTKSIFLSSDMKYSNSFFSSSVNVSYFLL